MGISIDKLSKQRLIFFSIVLMLMSLFTSRFLLSIGFIFFLFLTCFHKNILTQVNCLIRNRFLLGISFLFLIPFLTLFWTEDKNMWMRFVRIKLPLLLFPIAFAGNWQLSPKQWKWVAYVFLFLVIAGCCWSLLQYFQNIHYVHEQYLRAKLIPTPLENDHVRYSLMATIAVICLAVLMQQYLSPKKWLIPCVFLVFLIAYLHILSARTGLVSLYVFLFLTAFNMLFKQNRTRLFFVLPIIILAMPVAAWLLFPTFQNRIRYNLYDLSNIRQNRYVPGTNDGNRILSLKAGWNLLENHPFGVGGDVVQKTYQWYDINVPQMSNNEKLFPSSEPLMYGGFAGWIGFVLFFVIMLLPFFEQVNKNYSYWLLLNLIMALSFLFDIGLEAQFGVFVYVFTVLWWWKWFNTSSTNKAGS
jgi:O-antigen ligase